MKNVDESDVITWVQSWVQKHTNGDWEHQYGVHITTLDNPGWGVDIDLADTELATKSFSNLNDDRGDEWIMCRVRNGKFEGRGDTTKLKNILEIFRDWASGVTTN